MTDGPVEQELLPRQVAKPGSAAYALRASIGIMHKIIDEMVTAGMRDGIEGVSANRFGEITTFWSDMGVAVALVNGPLTDMYGWAQHNARHEVATHAKLRHLFFKTEKYVSIVACWCTASRMLEQLVRAPVTPDAAVVQHYSTQNAYVPTPIRSKEGIDVLRGIEDACKIVRKKSCTAKKHTKK